MLLVAKAALYVHRMLVLRQNASAAHKMHSTRLNLKSVKNVIFLLLTHLHVDKLVDGKDGPVHGKGSQQSDTHASEEIPPSVLSYNEEPMR